MPAWQRLLVQFRAPLVYLLLAAPLDYLQEAKAENAAAELAKITEATASVVRDGRVRRIPAAELVGGGPLHAEHVVVLSGAARRYPIHRSSANHVGLRPGGAGAQVARRRWAAGPGPGGHDDGGRGE